MKIKPKIYAQTLANIIESDALPKGIVPRFWRLLQKNNQSKNLSEILALVDKEYARKHNLVLAEVISGAELSAEQKQAIKLKLRQRFQKEILIKNIIKPTLTAGIRVKIDDREIDFSIEGKIKRLKQKLTNI